MFFKTKTFTNFQNKKNAKKLFFAIMLERVNSLKLRIGTIHLF